MIVVGGGGKKDMITIFPFSRGRPTMILPARKRMSQIK
jgi:hypothetical protein